MALGGRNDIGEIIRAAVDGVVARVSAKIAATIAEASKPTARSQPAAPQRGRRGGRGSRAARSRRPVEMTTWTTDRRARRVPKFVIEMTGLDTKKKLVAKFGENVTFRRGQPLPPARQVVPVAAPGVAKPPRIRKAATA